MQSCVVIIYPSICFYLIAFHGNACWGKDDSIPAWFWYTVLVSFWYRFLLSNVWWKLCELTPKKMRKDIDIFELFSSCNLPTSILIFRTIVKIADKNYPPFIIISFIVAFVQLYKNGGHASNTVCENTRVPYSIHDATHSLTHCSYDCTAIVFICIIRFIWTSES